MINPEDDIVVNPKTSCSREEVVAKLMGWLQGTRRRPLTEVTLHGISADQLVNMHTFDSSTVLELLQGHRREAQEAFLDAANSDDLVEIIQAKEMAVVECDRLIDKAQAYFVDFDDEVAKGATSALREDLDATERFGVTHYTLKSVDAWAMSNYHVSIINPSKARLADDDLPEYPVDERNDKGGLGRTSANSLYLTFAVLINAFVENNPNLSKDGSKPVVSVLAEYLSDRAKKPGIRKPIYGQKEERIMDRIEEAMKVYNTAMGLDAKLVK